MSQLHLPNAKSSLNFGCIKSTVVNCLSQSCYGFCTVVLYNDPYITKTTPPNGERRYPPRTTIHRGNNLFSGPVTTVQNSFDSRLSTASTLCVFIGDLFQSSSRLDGSSDSSLRGAATKTNEVLPTYLVISMTT